MSYTIKRIEGDEIKLVDKLLDIALVNEDIDWGCEFFGSWNGKNEELCGIAGFSLKKKRYPQFEHIIIHPDYQKTRLAVLLMKKVEDYLRSLGYGVYVTYILNTNNPMQVYAVKFGFQTYNQDDFGVWFYKQLNKEEK